MRSFKEGANARVLPREMVAKLVTTDTLKPLGRETRKHPHHQVRKLARSLTRFGFVLPIAIDSQNRVVAGWGLVLAARQLDLPEVPAVRLEGLTEAGLRALRLGLNRLAEESDWNGEELKLEITEIFELDNTLDLECAGFDTGEIDLLLNADEPDSDEPPVPQPRQDGEALCKEGDLWRLGEHRVLCGDALKPESYVQLLQGEKVEMVFTDPPYNVPIDGHVSGLGQVKHEEFAMASGEMSPDQFTDFLRTVFRHAVDHSKDGAIHFICMDWRHLKEIQAAGDKVYSELKNMCVWNKTNGGMGSLYRSKHELVFVYKVGTAPHINNVSLGRHGRNRSNVWDYPGANVVSPDRQAKLELHPTVKPVPLVADAIKDCSKRGGLVLDPFGGSGSTLLAAEKTGRRAALVEIDPRYVDVIIKRWRDMGGAEPELLFRKGA